MSIWNDSTKGDYVERSEGPEAIKGRLSKMTDPLDYAANILKKAQAMRKEAVDQAEENQALNNKLRSQTALLQKERNEFDRKREEFSRWSQQKEEYLERQLRSASDEKPPVTADDTAEPCNGSVSDVTVTAGPAKPQPELRAASDKTLSVSQSDTAPVRGITPSEHQQQRSQEADKRRKQKPKPVAPLSGGQVVYASHRRTRENRKIPVAEWQAMTAAERRKWFFQRTPHSDNYYKLERGSARGRLRVFKTIE